MIRGRRSLDLADEVGLAITVVTHRVIGRLAGHHVVVAAAAGKAFHHHHGARVMYTHTLRLRLQTLPTGPVKSETETQQVYSFKPFSEMYLLWF